MVATVSQESQRTHRGSNLATKLAALAGASGAVLSGEAMAKVFYTPTAGVQAAQGIPGFTFTSPTDITLGDLRPPYAPGNFSVNMWDIDGNSSFDFVLLASNMFNTAAFLGPRNSAALWKSHDQPSVLGSLNHGAQVGPGVTDWGTASVTMTRKGTSNWLSIHGNSVWFTDNPGYFGFKFTDGVDLSTFYYGWGSLVVDFGGSPATPGQGFKIMQAYYQSVANTPILVGQVPGGSPVPELPANTSALSLLAFGAAGLEALRKRKQQASAVA